MNKQQNTAWMELVATTLSTLKNKQKGMEAMMINFYAMQVEKGWITLEQVPKKYRSRVRELIETAHEGLSHSEG